MTPQHGRIEQISLEIEAEADRLQRENVYSAQGITRDWLRDIARRMRAAVSEPQKEQE